jgi:hypothetical protein
MRLDAPLAVAERRRPTTPLSRVAGLPGGGEWIHVWSSAIVAYDAGIMAMTRNELTSPARKVESLIVYLRGQGVILDNDLARLYGVPTKALVQAVNRNRSRFPPDFMVQLTTVEFAFLRSQFVTSNARGSGGRRYRPYAFT